MDAVEYDGYGSVEVLKLRQIKEPQALGPNELRVRPIATSVNPKNMFVRKGRFEALMDGTFLKRVGNDWAGVVEAVGTEVNNFAAGDAAYGMIDGWSGDTCADVTNVPAATAAVVDAGVRFEELAGIPLAA